MRGTPRLRAAAQPWGPVRSPSHTIAATCSRLQGVWVQIAAQLQRSLRNGKRCVRAPCAQRNRIRGRVAASISTRARSNTTSSEISAPTWLHSNDRGSAQRPRVGRGHGRGTRANSTLYRAWTSHVAEATQSRSTTSAVRTSGCSTPAAVWDLSASCKCLHGLWQVALPSPLRIRSGEH